jgi:hypothetical protein
MKKTRGKAHGTHPLKMNERCVDPVVPEIIGFRFWGAREKALRTPLCRLHCAGCAHLEYHYPASDASQKSGKC